MSIIETLTEGIVNRDMKKEGQALLNKWGKTGLLEGLQNGHQQATMARLLENQAKELLREALAKVHAGGVATLGRLVIDMCVGGGEGGRGLVG